MNALTKKWRPAMWLIFAAILSLPAIAMLVGAEGVDWDARDFLIIGTMMALLGLAIEFIVRVAKTGKGRAAGIGFAIFLFLWLWAELAVGVFLRWGS